MKKTLSVIFSIGVAAAAVAAPLKPEVVAEGTPTYDGVAPVNYVRGRQICPSDLRHRAVLIVQLDSSKLHSQLVQIQPLLGVDGVPTGEVQWDSMPEFPRKAITVLSCLGEPATSRMFSEALKVSEKEEKDDSARSLSYWSSVGKACYNNVKPAGEGDNLASTPYVYVMDGVSSTPLFKGKYSQSSLKKINEAMRKAKATTKEWKPLTGVAEIQHFKAVEKILLSGKPVQPCINMLVAGFKDKNPEKAKEAQTIYDAINQYAGDLRTRVMMEYRAAPARAFADLHQLIKLYPREKKALQMVDAKLKQNKSATTLGKMFSSFVEWNDPNFMFKNASDAKKAVVLANSWKKTLEKLSQDQNNPSIAGEAALILSQLDGIDSLLMSKVPQK